MKFFKAAFENFVHLFYPESCFACSSILLEEEDYVCLSCQLQLPQTNSHLFNGEHPVHQLFWGRVELKEVFANYYFTNGSKVQALMHEMKYRNQPQLAFFLGKQYASNIKDHLLNCNIDAIIPVPIHPKKKRIRGYNQSLKIAEGVKEVLGVPIIEDVLVRGKKGKSQTTKQRFDRWKGLKDTFVMDVQFEVETVLLVDDVITTGGTIEKCASLLKENGVKSVVVLSLAFADN